MERRPRIKLKYTTTDKVIEIVAGSSLLVVWGLIIVNYSDLPDIIPIHFNGSGEADRFEGKSNIWNLPIVASVLFIILSIVNRYPHIFNYPTKITKENAQRQYTYATRLIRSVKLIFVVVFGLVEFKTIQVAQGVANGLGTWFLPFVLAAVFIPIIYFHVKLMKKKPSTSQIKSDDDEKNNKL
jgi:uncharacterized membrane protein